MLFLFYSWVKKYWGRLSAFWGSFFLGFSAIFQEIARSGSYDAYSVLIAIAWIILFFHCARIATAFSYGLLGFFTGLGFYSYCTFRPLILSVFIETFRFARRKWASSFLFILGILLWVIPGIIILLMLLHSYQYHGPLNIYLVDKENLLRTAHGDFLVLFQTLIHNFGEFIKRMLGFNVFLDYPSRNQIHAHFLNHLLVIPMLLGIRQAYLMRKEFPNRLLLSLSIIIYLTPFFSSDVGNDEGRRCLIYILPTYCFIGLGMQQIFSWTESLKKEKAKSLAKLIILLGVSLVIVFELIFSIRYILNGQRDIGLMDFADMLNSKNEHATLVYLEQRQFSLYSFSNEGYLLGLLLAKNGSHLYDLEETLLDMPLKNIPGKFFLATSPLITKIEFQDWCQINELKCGDPIMESAVKNKPTEVIFGQPLGEVDPFKLYQVSHK